MFRRSWKSKMTVSERKRGLVFFLLYLLVFPRLNAWAQRVLMGDGETPVAEANVVYYVFLFALALFVFWSFLRKDFVDLLDWLPENLFSIAVGFLVAGGLYVLLEPMPFLVSDPIAGQYAEQFRAAPIPTLALILLLIPVVEETLFRGLAYGTLRAYSRPLAGVVSAAFYALSIVWRYALEYGELRYLLLALLYLPVSAALTWCYERGGSVWGCVLLHGGLNGLTLFMTL